MTCSGTVLLRQPFIPPNFFSSFHLTYEEKLCLSKPAILFRNIISDLQESENYTLSFLNAPAISLKNFLKVLKIPVILSAPVAFQNLIDNVKKLLNTEKSTQRRIYSFLLTLLNIYTISRSALAIFEVAEYQGIKVHAFARLLDNSVIISSIISLFYFSITLKKQYGLLGTLKKNSYLLKNLQLSSQGKKNLLRRSFHELMKCGIYIDLSTKKIKKICTYSKIQYNTPCIKNLKSFSSALDLTLESIADEIIPPCMEILEKNLELIIRLSYLKVIRGVAYIASLILNKYFPILQFIDVSLLLISAGIYSFSWIREVQFIKTFYFI